MRVLLVAPPRLLWPFMNEQDNFLLPQSLACLAANLREAGFDVTVLDCLPDQVGWRSLERRIRRLAPDVVAAGENHALYASEVIRLVELAKEIDPGVYTVLGGAHFTNVGEMYLDRHPIDFVVRGEGDVTTVDLVRALDAGGRPEGRRVDGVSYLGDDGQVVHNPPRPLVEDLDSLPLPAYDLMPMDRYGQARFLFSPGGTTIHHSRGCSSRCAYCVWWTQMADRTQRCQSDELTPRWRTKSVERTLEEIEILHRRFGKRCLVFVDPTFNLDPHWNDEFAEALIARDWDLTWFAFMRADLILRDEELGIFEKLVRSGLTHVSVGLERVDDAWVHGANKRFHTQDHGRRAFDLLRRRYPRVFRQATFIIGVRDETPEAIRRQLDYARDLQLDYPAFHAFTPFPGTEAWSQAQEEGWLEITDFDQFDMSTPLMGSETMTREEIEAALIDLNGSFVDTPWFLRGLLDRSSYRRNMYAWWLIVMARVFASTAAQRLNPFRLERYTSLVEPPWYHR